MKKLCGWCLLLWVIVAAIYALPYLKIPTRDHIEIVSAKGSVFTVMTAVSEQFAKYTNFEVPVVDSMLPEEVFSRFCGGIGQKYPDIASVSRRIQKEEFETCKNHGVSGITEIVLGSDAQARPMFIYIKHAQLGVIPGLYAYIRECVARDASGVDGYLVPLGLVSLSPAQHTEMARHAQLFSPLLLNVFDPH